MGAFSPRTRVKSGLLALYMSVSVHGCVCAAQGGALSTAKQPWGSVCAPSPRGKLSRGWAKVEVPVAAGRWLGAQEQPWPGQCTLREQPGLPGPDRDGCLAPGSPQPFSGDETLAPTSASLAWLRTEVSEGRLLAGFHCSRQGEVISAVVTGEGQ